ncbi:MAG: GNAT family N-acetyltransferase [Anaerolineales bacterium]|nr:GNAT family N-acetyltransferase [Anaerolineales bacterium]
MTDMLVKLYDFQPDRDFLTKPAAHGVVIRKPIGPEQHLIVDWVRDNFEDGWASEMDVALSNRPVTCFIACRGEALIGFACYDATALGFFGPGGVVEDSRGQGVGKALLLACLLDMQSKGYGYAVIGDAGPAEFYRKAVGAIEIPNSTPGVYRSMLRRGA